MRIQEGFVLHTTQDGYTVSYPWRHPLAGAAIVLDEIGALLWRELEQGTDPESLRAMLRNEFDLSQAAATRTVTCFLSSLREADCLDESD